MGSTYKLMVVEGTSLILFGNGLRIFTFRLARMFVNMNERIALLCICPTFLSSSWTADLQLIYTYYFIVRVNKTGILTCVLHT